VPGNLFERHSPQHAQEKRRRRFALPRALHKTSHARRPSRLQVAVAVEERWQVRLAPATPLPSSVRSGMFIDTRCHNHFPFWFRAARIRKKAHTPKRFHPCCTASVSNEFAPLETKRRLFILVSVTTGRSSPGTMEHTPWF
jgi:hypothetical protein